MSLRPSLGAIMRLSWTIQRRDANTRQRALQRAWAWAKAKAAPHAKSPAPAKTACRYPSPLCRCPDCEARRIARERRAGARRMGGGWMG